ncbi:MAG: hypothetical protein HQK50_02040 [Oligoflexia bacterium]|nr:hypothetical protein [Oligoflexia bacterium]MBF0364319.1 hypothetical protein [Oligoflexia bacterium]
MKIKLLVPAMLTFMFTFLFANTTIPVVYADPPATHGMLIFGEDNTYASHLPMFHRPHDYQLLMKVSFNAAPELLATYEEIKESTSSYFTIAPTPMDLTQVISGRKKSFLATLFSGHFERDGVLLGAVTVQVEQIIFSKRLDPYEQEDSLEHIVFGVEGEYFAAHLIKGRPSFDQILSINGVERENVLPLVISQNLLGQNATPAKVGEILENSALPSSTPANVLSVIYLEEEELSH